MAGDKFHWSFSLKADQDEPLDILVKVKLLKNLKDPSGQSSGERVTWRFTLSPEDLEVTKTLQLIDMCSEIEFSYKIASRVSMQESAQDKTM